MTQSDLDLVRSTLSQSSSKEVASIVLGLAPGRLPEERRIAAELLKQRGLRPQHVLLGISQAAADRRERDILLAGGLLNATKARLEGSS